MDRGGGAWAMTQKHIHRRFCFFEFQQAAQPAVLGRDWMVPRNSRNWFRFAQNPRLRWFSRDFRS